MRRQVLSALLGRVRPAARLSCAWLLALSGACEAPAEPAPAPRPTPAGVEEALAAAAAAEDAGDWRRALELLETATTGVPEAGREEHARRRLRAATAAGDRLARMDAAHELLETCPEDFELRLLLAEDLAETGAPDIALAQLIELETAAADPVARLRATTRAADCLARLGRHAEAAVRLESAALDPLAGARAAGWWERASHHWEEAGDRASATRALERALAGVELEEREAAALARLRAFELGRIETVSDALILLRFHDDAERRVAAARFLAAERFDDDVPAFGRALADPDERILRLCLVELAARVAPEERAFVAARVRGLLDHPSPEVRVAALDALGASGARADVPRLLEALDPEDRGRFRAARRALERLTGHDEPAPFDPDRATRGALREAWLAWWRAQGGV